MRPIVLEMDGFASFREPTTVDFADSDYFVLVGPTGSGKSTIIDALIFALYGSVPRWSDRRAVMYALAPTAIRGTVRLVFDMGDTRYVVARELRRTKTGVTVRNARLERLHDPRALGAVDDAMTQVAADGATSGAVEKLLGLSFEHFCQCVVLPQGAFSEFLRARGADRRAILLALLGVALYDSMRQRTNRRADLAGQKVLLLDNQLGGLADATHDAVAAAEQREDAVRAFRDGLTVTLAELAAVTGTLEQSRIRAERLAEEHQRLTSLRPPAGLTALEVERSAVAADLGAASAAEADAEQADSAARDRVSAAPPVPPLERALRDHEEQGALQDTLPAARTALASADAHLATTAQQRQSRVAELDAARLVRGGAAIAVADAAETTRRLRGEIAVLAGVTVPADAAAIAERVALAQREATAAASSLVAVEEAEATSRAALDAAPARGPLDSALNLLHQLEIGMVASAALEPAAEQAAASLERARADVITAGSARDAARSELDAVSAANTAATLRPLLAVGAPCPVCDRTVDQLPSHLVAPELAVAQMTARSADQGLHDCLAAETVAAQAAAAAAAHLAAARQHVDRLRAGLGGNHPDGSAIRAQLTVLDALTDAARWAKTAVDAARKAQRSARQAADGETATEAALRSALARTRDPLVALGAPAVDQLDILRGWQLLAEWSGGAQKYRSTGLSDAETAAAAAEHALAIAQRDLRAAESAADDGYTAENRATGRRERAAAHLASQEARSDQLAAALHDAPSAAEAHAELARLQILRSAATAADLALRLARIARREAAEAAETSTRSYTAAWQSLRTTRDGFVAFGAPELSDGSVAKAWSELTGWAAERAEVCAADLMTERARASTAVADLDRQQADLRAELVILEIPVPAGALLTGAAAAVAGALAQADAHRADLVKRRAQAGRLTGELAAAEEERQVAHLLGSLLRSDKFPAWLERAALDTLVVEASAHLEVLSNEQFALTHRDGEFFVIDHADADAQRSVRTLSGGETFQASLALALALSSQLSSMSATGAVRLESIFLDEGFGTLDEASLEVVAETLENLSKGDRMVGIITHVAALADRIPIRYTVTRDNRSSRVEREEV